MEFLEGNFGIEIIRFFQSGALGKILELELLPFHYLGSEMGYLILMPIIYWSFNKKLGRDLFFLVLLSTIFTNLFKVWWKRPRPFHVAPNAILPIENTKEFGLPSGHTIFGTVLGLSLAKFSKKKWQVFLSVLIIVLMGVSRMVHGMHFLQDVVLGWILGIIFFTIFQKTKPFVSNIFNRLNLIKQILIITLLAFLCYVVFILMEGDFEFEKSLLSPLGGLYGVILGIIIDSHYIRFIDNKKIKIRVLRILVGLCSMVAVYLIAEYIYYFVVNENQSNFVLFFYLIRYSIVGFWITAGAPLLFSKFNLK